MLKDSSAGMRFDSAVLMLPSSMRDRIRSLARRERERVQEIRLRAGRAMGVLLPEGELEVGTQPVTRRELDGLLDIVTGASAYASRESVKAGYITVRGGFRIGLCGSAIVSHGEIMGFRTLTSAAIRFPHEIRGVSNVVMSRLTDKGGFCSTLIIAPPGAGKTTLLRDVVRSVSDGVGELRMKGLRVGLADERGEVACVCDGEAQMDVGRLTDVIDSCPKSESVMMLLRTMNPQVIALDEITAPEDAHAIESAANCGVKLIATAHANNVEELCRKELYKRIIDLKIFGRVVTVRSDGGMWSYEVTNLEAE